MDEQLLTALGQINSRLATMEAHLGGISRQLSEHHHSLYGDGNPGVVMEVDRLKQAEKRRGSFVTGVWALVVAVAGHLAWLIASAWQKN